MLKANVLWPVSRRFKSRTEWEPVGFFSEALCNSTYFDLKLGFFSSSAINVLADGFASFLYGGGRMRMVINDILSEEDRMAIEKGQSAGKSIPYFDLNDIETLKLTLSERDRHFFECLSWLIRYDRIEIKIIRPKDSNGISHSKIGVFGDGLNKVAFDGSCNFSRTALIENRESISAFCDWDSPNDAVRVRDIATEFEVTFTGSDDTVTYLDAVDVRTKIKQSFDNKEINQLLEDEEKLIDAHSKMLLPDSIIRTLGRARHKVDSIIEKIKEDDGVRIDKKTNVPSFPYGTPRDYQIAAYDNWKSEPNKQKGLFAMATGTGKTLTSLNCLLNIYNKYHYYKALILVPTITLVDQWEQECKKFHFDNIVKVCSKNHNWKNDLDGIKAQESLNFSGSEPSYIIISTYASFARENIFLSLIDFSNKALRQILLIADEAHNMGAGRIVDRLEGVKFARRIGLSATPERQFDDIANKKLMHFFGCENDQYTFEYPMQKAIDNGYLCRYYYYPHLVRLTDEEMTEYIKISNQLCRLYTPSKEGLFKSNDMLTLLLLKRKSIIHKARNKENVFKEIIKGRLREKGNLKYTLVYVPEGNQPFDEMSDYFDESDTMQSDIETEHIINTYTQIVKNASPTTTVRRFTSGVQGRNAILDDFSNGKLEVLTSMKCLDEGVDVPRSELAIFCASTGNPRQFIQRRGRILRLHPDKHNAVIHDLVVAPEINSAMECYNMERSLLAGELKRVKDFALMSENADTAICELEEVLNYYDLSIFK